MGYLSDWFASKISLHSISSIVRTASSDQVVLQGSFWKRVGKNYNEYFFKRDSRSPVLLTGCLRPRGVLNDWLFFSLNEKGFSKLLTCCKNGFHKKRGTVPIFIRTEITNTSAGLRSMMEDLVLIEVLTFPAYICCLTLKNNLKWSLDCWGRCIIQFLRNDAKHQHMCNRLTSWLFVNEMGRRGGFKYHSGWKHFYLTQCHVEGIRMKTRSVYIKSPPLIRRLLHHWPKSDREAGPSFFPRSLRNEANKK